MTGTSLAYAGLVEFFQTDVAGSNALTDGASYLTTPAVAGLLRQRFTSTDSPLWAGNLVKGSVLGFDAHCSNGVPGRHDDFRRLVANDRRRMGRDRTGHQPLREF